MKLPLGSLFWHEGGKPKAETIVFLHGSWHDSTQWLPLLQRLGSQHHCLAPDLLGFGESSVASTYSVALQVEALRSLLSALRISHCRLVGHSLGAWVAGQYALTYPEQVQGLAVMAPEGVTEAGLGGRWRRDRWLAAPWSPLPWVLPWLGKSAWAKELRDRRQCLHQHPAACRTLFQRRSAAIEGELLQQRLGQLAVPTLIIDPTPADSTTQRLAQIWRQQLSNPYAVPIAAANTPLGVEAADLATALGQWIIPQAPQTTDHPGPSNQTSPPLGQLI
ncbi:alpha/beta hydrolase [Nodosilinea sp. E11]|uniref:alpha/beta fold hydrolase n=1 Tax=Nodosilinea sp. E11 TaxID=3037479 RepID=UPI002934FBC1|nr:alpha/beta hydrolase [Nodosilinea sp. E11]WOD38046.1 alpha/beta hydrolase [Nodosilinea sp. E11]